MAANTDKVISVPGSDLTAIERQWIVVSLRTQHAVLSRSRNKEMTGSEIWNLRTRELDQLSALVQRFST